MGPKTMCQAIKEAALLDYVSAFQIASLSYISRRAASVIPPGLLDLDTMACPYAVLVTMHQVEVTMCHHDTQIWDMSIQTCLMSASCK